MISRYNVVSHGEPGCIISTVASSKGWGCTLGEIRSGGNWTIEDAQNHINYIQLFAVFLALQIFEKNLIGKHVKAIVDNMTALSDINHMALVNLSNEMIEKTKWIWCHERQMWFTAVHIPRVDNLEADKQS